MTTIIDIHPSLTRLANREQRRRHRWTFFQRLLLSPRKLGLVFLILAAFSLLLHASDVWRPIDDTTDSAWRECDLGMIARNFWRGDMNIFYPQIDWRKQTPGYVESELPLLSWMMALGYHGFGYHEEIGRVLDLLVALATLWAFYRLAHKLLPPFQAKVAWILFAYSPILIDLATNIQPDPGMLLFSIIALNLFIDWLRTERWKTFILCGLAGALAILLKSPAVLIGIPIAGLCFEKFGPRLLRNPRLWILGLLMLAPPLAWFFHAHAFWLKYGNSLGISNETHWFGLDLLRHPHALAGYIKNALRIELILVFGIFGAVLAWGGLFKALREQRAIVYWALGVALFYGAAIRTIGDDWAYYYHCLSVPPACLLIGLGCSPFTMLRWRRPGNILRALKAHALQICLLLTLAVLFCQSLKFVSLIPPRIGDSDLHDRYVATEWFEPLIAKNALVVTIGGPGFDEIGTPVAYDDSAFLFWLDRKGIVLCKEEMNLPNIMQAGQQGGKYLIIRRNGKIDHDLSSHLKLLASRGHYDLYAYPKRPPSDRKR